MKGFVKFLCSGLLVLLMLVGTGNAVFAHGDDCGCNATPVEGAEKVKAVAKVLLTKDFWQAKSDLYEQGYKYMVVSDIEVVKMPNPFDSKIVHTIVAIPFKNNKGEILFAGFTDGQFMGVQPPDTH